MCDDPSIMCDDVSPLSDVSWKLSPRRNGTSVKEFNTFKNLLGSNNSLLTELSEPLIGEFSKPSFGELSKPSFGELSNNLSPEHKEVSLLEGSIAQALRACELLAGSNIEQSKTELSVMLLLF